jgi:hypothetical protein
MLDTVIGPEVCEAIDDIESELSSSSGTSAPSGGTGF